MKIIIFAFLCVIFFHTAVSAQEDIKAKHAAYYLCLNNMGKEPINAFSYCSDYLSKYPDDDKRLTDFVKGWLVAYEKISLYLASTNGYFVAGSEQNWSIYKSELTKQIPVIKETDSPYKIQISRDFSSKLEDELLRKAEAVYPNPKNISSELFNGWQYLSNPDVDLPNGEPKWWAGTSNSILSTNVVTTGAVIYYYDIWRKLQIDNKQKFGGFVLISSKIDYSSSIKKMAKYERGEKSFSNVYVADMNLTWGFMCGDLCGKGFTRNKVVVLNEKGEVLEMFLDNPVNRRFWVS